ncbi:MAG: hypothetical protein AAF408_15715 [Pseudomonadota bacterium]
MPILLAALGLLAAAAFWYFRIRNVAHTAQDLLEAANDVRLAARRFGFRRNADIHPVEAIEDPRIALAALGAGFLELDDFPTAEQRDALVSALRENLNVKHDDAEELLILGRWLVGECNGPQQAIPRLTRRLYKLSGQQDFEAVMALVKFVARFGTGDLSAKQKAALKDIQHGLKIK